MPHSLRSFRFVDSDLVDYIHNQPKWANLLAYVTYKRTYSRELPNGGKEEYWQTIRRVVEGVFSVQKNHCRSLRLPWSDAKAKRSALEMFRQMWEFKWLPPGRGLWMMGTDYMFEHGGAALLNCWFVSTDELATDFAAPFSFMMDRSMLGGGVGFDLLGTDKVKIREPRVTEETHCVEDSREGWIRLIERTLNAFVGKDSLPASIDYTQVRKFGMKIKGFGGTSSGAEPLISLQLSIVKILTARIGQRLTSIDILDLENLIGKCVVAGNVRRSAQICLGLPTDDAYLFAKSAVHHADELKDRRWASNNSVFAEHGMNYEKVAELTADNGEPGYVWLHNARAYGRMKDGANWKDRRVAGINPCGEITLESWEACNLAETFPAHHDTLEEFQRTLKMAYMYSKTVTLLPTHDERTNSIIMRNRRIGLSQSGIVQAVQKFGYRQYLNWCDTAYAYVQELDEQYSGWLCVPKSVKTTTVKPSGTISLVAGATPGMHYPHSEYYIRRVRFGQSDAILPVLERAGYKSEPDYYSTGAIVVEFPVKEENFSKSKDDVSMWDQLELAAALQHIWADNSVSCTVTVTQEEGRQIAKALADYEKHLKSVSFLPIREHGYKQAPYESISKEEYETMMARLQEPDFEACNEVDHQEQKGCDGDSCIL